MKRIGRASGRPSPNGRHVPGKARTTSAKLSLVALLAVCSIVDGIDTGSLAMAALARRSRTNFHPDYFTPLLARRSRLCVPGLAVSDRHRRNGVVRRMKPAPVSTAKRRAGRRAFSNSLKAKPGGYRSFFTPSKRDSQGLTIIPFTSLRKAAVSTTSENGWIDMTISSM